MEKVNVGGDCTNKFAIPPTLCFIYYERRALLLLYDQHDTFEINHILPQIRQIAAQPPPSRTRLLQA